MKAQIPVELNHWRLKETHLATEDDANYEGCFIIPSEQKDPDKIGHPFDYHAIFQIQSSEIAGGVQSGTEWEKVTVIVKIERPGGVLEQRKPNGREIRWIKSLFWEDWETCCEFHGSHEAHLSTDHRVLHLMRKADGSMDVPELYRELVPDFAPAPAPDGEEPEFEERTSVFDLLKRRREKAHKREREEKVAQAGRHKAEVKRILDTAEYRAPDSPSDQLFTPFYAVQAPQMDRLRELLDIE